MFCKINKNTGFTLIELMVVITIIGLLASTVLASLTTARAKARDAARVQVVKELQKALELYRNANGGNYPCSSSASTLPPCQSGGSLVNANGTTRNSFFDAMIDPYMKLVNETVITPATTGSIKYRVGSATGSATGTPNRDNSYLIVLTRELSTQCAVRVGLNTNPAVPDPNCF